MNVRAPYRRPQAGQSSLEFVIVCAALAIALGVGISGETSVVKMLLDAFTTAYRQISYAISLPG